MDNFDVDSYLAQNQATPQAEQAVAPDALQLSRFDVQDYLNENNQRQEDALQAKFGGPLQTFLAGSAGLARGATLGGSDLFLTKSGLVDPATLKGLEEANPVASFGGQLLGGGALIGATGGLGGLAEGAGLAGEAAQGVDLAGGLGQMITQPATSGILGTAGKLSTPASVALQGIEGGLFGLGTAATDYAMGDKDLNAQKILADVGFGAAVGTGFGVLGKAAEVALPKATSKLIDSFDSLKKMTIGTEEQPGALVKAVSYPGAVATGQAPEEWVQSFYKGLEAGDPNANIRKFVGVLNDMFSSAKEAASDLYEKAAPANIGKALEEMPVENAQGIGKQILKEADLALNEAEPLVKAGAEVEPSSDIKFFEGKESKLGSVKGEIINKSLEEAQNRINSAKSAYDVFSAVHDFAKDIGSGGLIKWDKIPTPAQEEAQNLLKNVNSAVRGHLSDAAKWGEEATTHFKQLSENYSKYIESSKAFQKQLMQNVAGAGAPKKYEISPTKVKSLFNNFNDPSQDIKKRILNDFINEAKNVSEASENYHGFEAGEKSVSQRISKLASENEEVAKVAEALMKKPQGPSRFGEGLGAMTAHAIGIPDPVIGAAIGATEAYRAIKNPYITGANLAGIASKLKAIGKIAQGVTERVNDAAVKAISSGPAKTGAAFAGALSAKEYNEITGRISKLARDPASLSDHLDKSTDQLDEAAPNISGGVKMAMTNGVNFLASKIKQPDNDFYLKSKADPSDKQIRDFSVYYHAVNDPVSVLNQIKAGSLSSQSMEALDAVHPHLLNEMKMKVMDQMTPEKVEALKPQQKIALAKFLGQPLTASQVPQSIAANQASMQGPQLSQQSAPRLSRQTTSAMVGARNMKIANRVQSDTRKTEENE